MRHDLRPLLRDIDLAAADHETFVLGLTEGGYESSPLVKAAVERKFTVIGEALVLHSPSLSGSYSANRGSAGHYRFSERRYPRL